MYLRRKQCCYAHHLWVHPIRQPRERHGEFQWLVQQLRLDNGHFQRCFRLDIAQFDDLLARVWPHISKQVTNYKPAISEWLAKICLLRVTVLLYSMRCEETATISLSYIVNVFWAERNCLKYTVGQPVRGLCIVWLQVFSRCNLPQKVKLFPTFSLAALRCRGKRPWWSAAAAGFP